MTPPARLPRSLRGLGLALCGAALVGSCSLDFKGTQGPYRLSERTSAILADDPDAQRALAAELERLFGTPEAPRFAPPGEALNRRAQAGELVTIGVARPSPGAPAPALRASAALYAKKCLHCHGNEGGGDGPTSATARPRPRDFRHGLFKYDDLVGGARPELSDLVAVITRGVPGTAMPSARLQTEAELHGLAEYVRLLAMRGEVEQWLAAEYEPQTGVTQAKADEVYAAVLELWRDAERVRLEAPTPAPEPTEATIRAGFELYHDASRANCVRCHGANGRGRGPSAWGPLPEDPDTEGWLLADAWGHPANPRNLVEDTLLHGETAADLYVRISLGIDGTPMPGIGNTVGPAGEPFYREEDVWSLVHYVLALRSARWSALIAELSSEL